MGNIRPDALPGQVRIVAPGTDPLTEKELRRIPWLSPRAVELYVYLARIVQAKRRDREMPFALVGFPAMARELDCSIRSAKAAMDELKGFVAQKVRLPGGKSQYVRQQVGYPLVRGWRLARRPGRKLVRVCSYALLEVRVDQLVEMSASLSSNLTCPPPPAPPESAPVSALVSALLSSNLFLESTGIKAAGEPPQPEGDVQPQPQEVQEQMPAAAVHTDIEGQKRKAKARFREKAVAKVWDFAAAVRFAHPLQAQKDGAHLLKSDAGRVTLNQMLDLDYQPTTLAQWQQLFSCADLVGIAGLEALVDYIRLSGKVVTPGAWLGGAVKGCFDRRAEVARLRRQQAEAKQAGVEARVHRRGAPAEPTGEYHRRPGSAPLTTTAPMRRSPEEEAASAKMMADLTAGLRAGAARAASERQARRALRAIGTSPAGPQELGEVLGWMLEGATAAG